MSLELDWRRPSGGQIPSTPSRGRGGRGGRGRGAPGSESRSLRAQVAAFMSPTTPAMRLSLEQFALHMMSTWPVDDRLQHAATSQDEVNGGLGEALRKLDLGDGSAAGDVHGENVEVKFGALSRTIRVSAWRLGFDGFEFTLKPGKTKQDSFSALGELPPNHPACKVSTQFFVATPKESTQHIPAGASFDPDSKANQQIDAEKELAKAWDVAVGLVRSRGAAPAAAPAADRTLSPKGSAPALSWVEQHARRPSPERIAAARGSDFELRMANPGGLGPANDALRPWAAHMRTGTALVVMSQGVVDVQSLTRAAASRLQARSEAPVPTKNAAAEPPTDEFGEKFAAVGAVPLSLLMGCTAGRDAGEGCSTTAAQLALEHGIEWHACTADKDRLEVCDREANRLRASVPAPTSEAPGDSDAGTTAAQLPVKFGFRFHVENAMAGLRAHDKDRAIDGYPVNKRAGTLGHEWDGFLSKASTAAGRGSDNDSSGAPDSSYNGVYVLMQATYHRAGSADGKTAARTVMLDITGGGRQAGESSLACALREGDEEAGLGALDLQPLARVDMCDYRGTRARAGYPRTGEFDSYATLHILEAKGFAIAKCSDAQ